MRVILFGLLCIASLNAIAKNEGFTLEVISSDYINKELFATWQGIEPDKWATVWLIKRYLSPDSAFTFVPPGTSLPENSVHFGVSSSPLKRSNRQAMFHHLVSASNLHQPEVLELDKVIYDLEVNIWDTPDHPHAAWIEALYRQLQDRYRRDRVPVDCYLSFFDGVAEIIVNNEATAQQYEERLSLKDSCPGLQDKKSEFVGQIGHLELLRKISLGEKVVFIDTREQEEFNELHLPGAKKISLREVNAESVAQLKDADLIVPYCIKDFRGFEVAKAIKLNGGDKVATLSPNGLKGWLNAKLPVANTKIPEQEAKQQLLLCSMEPQKCIKGD